MQNSSVNHVRLGDQTITVRVMSTPMERASGMSNRMELDEEAMLFVYEHPTFCAFTARTCPLPLDVAFFDGDGCCVGFHSMQPFSEGPYWPDHVFRWALEFPAGRFAIDSGTRLRVEMP